MAHPDGPAAQRVLLGAQLRAARTERELSATAATDALNWKTPAKLSKIEAGTTPISDADLSALVKLYRVPAKQAASMHDLAAEARRKLPASRVAEFASRYVHLVAAAYELRLWQPDAWPGTVQTVDYARAQLRRSVVVAAAEVDRRAEERAERVRRLYATGRSRLWLVVGEHALHAEIGGPHVLRGQLERVRQLAELGTVTVQVMPLKADAHAAHGVAFSLIRIIESGPGLVYVEHLTGADYLGREHVPAYELAFETLAASALAPGPTMDLITRRIDDLR